LPDRPRREVSALSRFIKRWTLPFYVGVALLNVILVPMALWAFPRTTLTLTLIILITGALNALGTLGDALVAHEQNETLDSIDDSTSDD
jgi:hypothetical protein